MFSMTAKLLKLLLKLNILYSRDRTNFLYFLCIVLLFGFSLSSLFYSKGKQLNCKATNIYEALKQVLGCEQTVKNRLLYLFCFQEALETQYSFNNSQPQETAVDDIQTCHLLH